MNISLSPIKSEGCEGAKVSVDLSNGFLSASGDSSVKDWKVVVGYSDGSEWHQCGERAIKSDKASQKMSFNLDVADLGDVISKGRSLEIRVFNDNGVPAERVNVSFQAMPWASSVVGQNS